MPHDAQAHSNELPDDASAQIRIAKDGDLAARQQLVLRHHNSLMGLIQAELSAKLRTRLDPEDVLQDIYAEVLRNFDGFEGESPDQLRHWIHAVARNRVRELHRLHLQTAKRAAGLEQRALPGRFSQTSQTLISALQAHSMTASQKAVRVEALDALAASLAMLAPHYRQVVEMRYLQGMTVDETAEAIGNSKGAVLMISHRALRQMTKLIADFPLLTRSG